MSFTVIHCIEPTTPSFQVELQWWLSNRTFNITSPFTNVTRAVAHYAVDINSAPRPEVRYCLSALTRYATLTFVII